MSETELGREPVQIVEIITPKCANVHGTAPCAATETGDDKCFNTRVTCNDTDNFQARPLAYLSADVLLNNGDTITATDFDRTASALFEVEVNFKSFPTGTLFAIGSATNFVYLGVTGTDLVFAAGGQLASNQARAVTPLTNLAGRSLTLICEIDFAGNTVTLYEFDPVEYVLTQLATDAADAAFPVAWAAATDGEVGDDSGITYGSEDGGAYNGTILSFRGHSDQTATLFPGTDDYRQRYFFDDGRKAKPSDDIYILPALLSASTVGSRINIAASDERYEPLGRRAFASFTFADFNHTDFKFDPYLSDRTYDPLDRSTFWAKWLVRNKFGKTRALMKIYSGYDGDALADMRTQTYVLDRLGWGRESVTIEARDFLSLTEFRRAQVPAQSSGKLALELLAAGTTMSLAGNVVDDYPSAGTVRIDDELIQYTTVTYVMVSDTTEFTGLTRASDGSEADDHEVDELVQICKRYTNQTVDALIEDLVVNEARVPAQVIDLAKITSEVEANLQAYTLSTIISEPTGIDQLVGELAEQCSFYIWWNEREQLIDFQAIRALDSVNVVFSQEDNMIMDTFEFEERPKERITTMAIYFNPRDFAGDLEKPNNYKNVLVFANSNTSGPDQYGRLPQTREVFSRWLQTEAQANQTSSRIGTRYEDVPLYVKFKVDAKDRQYWAGDFARLSHDQLVLETGLRDEDRRWLIIEAEEVEPGHSQMIRLVDVTLDGLIYRITANGIGNYTKELFDAGNAFITDNNGLNPDGTRGARIV